MESHYLTVQEVAARCRVDPNTVRRWCQSGLLKADRLGPRLVRISADEVARFLKAGSE